MKRLGLLIILFPLQLLLLILFAMAEVLRALAVRFVSGRDQSVPEKVRERLCTIIVLNWNGRHLLEESLPPLRRAVSLSGKAHQILVVDNGSEDDSLEWLNQHFPEVDVLCLPENIGFSEGNNAGVKAARHQVVVLLNNDMIVFEDFLDPLLAGFDDPTVFAVSSQILFPEGKRREETGNTGGHFRFGYLHLSHEPIRQRHYTRKLLPVLWAGGGSSAFRRDRFLAMGGFSSEFSPCYFEDTDLSYRAWRRGWKVLLAADSKVLHKHRSSTLRRFTVTEIEDLVERRRCWYLWRNYQLRTLLPHLLLFPFHLTVRVPVRSYIGALRRLPRILSQRLLEPRRAVTDRQLSDWLTHPLEYLNRFHPGRARGRPGAPLRILSLSAYLPHLGTHGGAGRVFQLLKRVAERHEVHVLTFLEGDSERGFVEQAEQFCRRVHTVTRRDYQRISCFPYEPFEEFNSRDFRRQLEELLAQEDFDLVHFEWPQMTLYADLLPFTPRLLTEVEVSYAAHYTMVKVESNPFRKFRLLYNTFQTLYREVEACRRVHRVVCVTDDDREYLRGYLPDERLKVIKTGVDTQYFHRQGHTFEKGALVFVGAFRHFPNVDAVLYFCSKILPEISRSFPEVKLYIVGSSPPPEIQKLDDGQRIRVTGYQEDIREFYRRGQVVVVPLRTGVGIRGKILEAWASGRATVATPLACQGLGALHGENVMIAQSAAEFAMWTCALLRNPDACARIGEKARTTVEKLYDWSLMGREASELYEQVVRETTTR